MGARLEELIGLECSVEWLKGDDYLRYSPHLVIEGVDMPLVCVRGTYDTNSTWVNAMLIKHIVAHKNQEVASWALES